MGTKIDFVNIIQTAVKVITSPARFFKEMPRTGGFIEPLVFMIVMGFIGSLIQALLSVAGLSPAGPDIDAVSIIIVLTIVIVVSGFIAAAVYFAIWKLMGSQESYETAFRCNAYISALIPVAAIFNPIPYLSQIIAIVLTTFFLVIASVYVHGLPLKKAGLVFGILGLIFIMVSIAGEVTLRRLEGTEMDMQENFQEIQNINKEPHRALVQMHMQIR